MYLHKKRIKSILYVGAMLSKANFPLFLFYLKISFAFIVTGQWRVTGMSGRERWGKDQEMTSRWTPRVYGITPSPTETPKFFTVVLKW